MSKCTGKSKRTGERCGAQALTGKDVCYHHQGRPVVHGRYSKYKDQLFGERRAELLESPDLLSIENQIALLLAMQEKFLTDLNTTGRVGHAERETIIRMTDSIVKSIEKVRKLEQDVKLPDTMHNLISVVINVVNANCDEPTRRAIANSLDRLPLPAVAGNGKRAARELGEGSKAETTTARG